MRGIRAHCRAPVLGSCFLSQVHQLDTMQYFTDAIIEKCIRWGQSPFLIGVFGSPNDHMPIGVAREIGGSDTNTPAWSIRVRGVAVPGRFVVVDGEFKAVEPGVA
jgi:hypothetical protein